MSCEYCEGGFNSLVMLNLLTSATESFDIQIIDGILQATYIKRADYGKVRRLKTADIFISYCPMCGEKLGGDESWNWRNHERQV